MNRLKLPATGQDWQYTRAVMSAAKESDHYGTSVLPVLAGGGCGTSRADTRAEALAALRIEVDRLAGAVAARFESDPAFLAIGPDSGDVVVRADTRLVEMMLREGTQAYLDSVSLHLTLDVEVGDRGEVRQSLRFFSLPVGSWEVRVTIQRIDATLHAEPVQLAVADSNRLNLTIPVVVRQATGQARVRFTWDAASVPGLFCKDFELDETFSGFVEETRYHLTGFFEFEARDHGVIAMPYQTERISVSPEPGFAGAVADRRASNSQIASSGIRNRGLPFRLEAVFIALSSPRLIHVITFAGSTPRRFAY